MGFFRKLTCSEFGTFLTRRKAFEPSETPLAKKLTTIDLIFLAIGSTLGVGVYVLAGQVAKLYAGPGVLISFFIAAIASMLSGLCYAEFGARVPKSGSAYSYSYITIGECIAFFIGWNLILEYCIGAASVVKGLFTYTDSICSNAISKAFRAAMPINVEHMSPFPDFFSFSIIVLFTIALALGVKQSSILTAIFTCVNLIVILIVIISIFTKANPANLNIPQKVAEAGKEDPKTKVGVGGFLPFGFRGVISGAATCFYAFVGFDIIATASEETKNPKKSIPLSIIISLSLVFLIYFAISLALVMALPYYLQHEEAPFPNVFKRLKWRWAEIVVVVGAICGLSASLLGALFPLPRIIFAIGVDGLICALFKWVHPKFKTPFYATLISGFLTALLACFFELKHLIPMMSIGTLFAYSMVAACCLYLRYDEGLDNKPSPRPFTCKMIINQIIGGKPNNPITELSVFVSSILITLFVFMAVVVAMFIQQGDELLSKLNPFVLCGLILSLGVVIFILVFLSFQPRSTKELSFKVPLSPWLPSLSILINFYLMVMLDYMTWIRFGVWIAIGMLIYFLYGMWNSVERHREEETKGKVQEKKAG